MYLSDLTLEQIRESLRNSPYWGYTHYVASSRSSGWPVDVYLEPRDPPDDEMPNGPGELR
jgi:hypothetical protein